jgi:hypothetical protein
LNVSVEAFDQVFETPTSSRGIVQLRATLTKGVGQKADVQTTQVSTERTALSADAQGGVAALDGASAEAVLGVLDWVVEQDCK